MKPNYFTKFSSSTIIRICTAVLNYALILFVTQNFPPEEAGVINILIVVMINGSLLGQFGMDTAILRYRSQKNEHVSMFDAVSTGIVWVGLFTIFFSAIVFISALILSKSLFRDSVFIELLSTFILAFPALSITLVIAAGFHVHKHFVKALVFQNLCFFLLFLVIVNLYLWSSGSLFNVHSTAYLFVVSAYITLIIALYIWFRFTKMRWGTLNLYNPDLFKIAINTSSMNFSLFLLQTAPLVIAGSILGPIASSFLLVAHRTAHILALPLNITNQLAAPQLAQLWSQSKMNEFVQLAKLTNKISSLVGMPIFLLMIIYPDSLLALFGEDYNSARGLLIVLACGQLINVVTGSVGYVLIVSGHEKEYKRICFISAITTMILTALLANTLGNIGASFAFAVGTISLNVISTILVKKRLGSWTIV